MSDKSSAVHVGGLLGRVLSRASLVGIGNLDHAAGDLHSYVRGSHSQRPDRGGAIIESPTSLWFWVLGLQVSRSSVWILGRPRPVIIDPNTVQLSGQPENAGFTGV